MKWLSDSGVERLLADLDLPDLSDTPYTLVRKVATGGMGTVYLAEDQKLNRRIALKVMKQVDVSEELAARMLSEARVLARLEHPNIVPVHDVGVLPDGRAFYAMKFVEGERLDEHARAGNSRADLLRVFQKICEAVAFAHAHGVLHRDLKPENIMVGQFGEVLVMDWGVAKLVRVDGAETSECAAKLGSDRPLDTVDGTVVGTPAYMAPEQARGESVDERADVYALGMILRSLLTGKQPAGPSAPRDSDVETRPLAEADRIKSGGLRLRSSAGQKVPRRIEAVCLKAMARDPAARYAGARELAADIAAYLDGLPVSAYRENVLERGSRWVEKNRFVTLLVIAYLLMRVVLFLVTGR